MKKTTARPHGSTERDIEPGSAWENATTFITAGTSDAFEASWYLTKSRLWALIHDPHAGPFVFGIVMFLIVGAIVILAPTADSHFIYTDF